MIYNNKYVIFTTTSFKKKLGEIIYYLKYKLNQPLVAKSFYLSVINQINSLKVMPERYKRIEKMYDKTKNIRKMPVNNYIIIYQVDNDTRANYYSKYFSQYTKL